MKHFNRTMPTRCAALRRTLLGHVVVFSMAGLFTGCGPPSPNRLQGYLEGEFVYVAAPHAGALEKLAVARGTQVKAGEPLFALDSAPEQAARDEAERRLSQAQASLEDAKKGKRPSEMDSLAASLKQAQVALALSEKELLREESLLSGVAGTTEQAVDRARSARDQNRQRVAQLEAELATARLGARTDQVAAAEANARALEAALAKAEWNLAQKSQRAPQSALVFDTLYREGEWVAAGRPVVVLLPPQNIKLRLFVSEPQLGSLQLGDTLEVFRDGVSGSVPAKVSFISPKAEYSPPMIYSRENRRKFVYLVEASFEPDAATSLHPGQPVEVQFAGRQP